MDNELLREDEIQALLNCLLWGNEWIDENDIDNLLEWAQDAKSKNSPILLRLLTSNHFAVSFSEDGEIRFAQRPPESYPPL